MAEPITPKGRSIPPTYYAIGAGALAVAYFLYSRSKSNAAAAAGASATDATGAANSAQSQNDAVTIATLSQQLADLQGANATSSTGGLTNYQAPSGETVSGFGLAPGQGTTSVVGPTGTTYSLIANAKARNALTAAGQTVYYQPAPGVFAPFNPATMKGSHTPTYVAIGGS